MFVCLATFRRFRGRFRGPGPGAETEWRLGGGAADGEDAAGGGAEGPRFLGLFRMEKNWGFYVMVYIYIYV